MQMEPTIGLRDSFDEAVKTQKRGDHIIYHVGYFLTGPHRQSALAASDAGRVLLTQKRVPRSGVLRDMFAYRATVA